MNQFDDCGDPVEGSSNVTSHQLNKWYEKKIEKMGWMLISDSPTKIDDMKRYYCGLKKLQKSINSNSVVPSNEKQIMANNVGELMMVVKKYINYKLGQSETRSISEVSTASATAPKASTLSKTAAAVAAGLGLGAVGMAAASTAPKASTSATAPKSSTLSDILMSADLSDAMKVDSTVSASVPLSHTRTKTRTETGVKIAPKFTSGDDVTVPTEFKSMLTVRPSTADQTVDSVMMSEMSERPSFASSRRSTAPVASSMESTGVNSRLFDSSFLASQRTTAPVAPSARMSSAPMASVAKESTGVNPNLFNSSFAASQSLPAASAPVAQSSAIMSSAPMASVAKESTGVTPGLFDSNFAASQSRPSTAFVTAPAASRTATITSMASAPFVTAPSASRIATATTASQPQLMQSTTPLSLNFDGNKPATNEETQNKLSELVGEATEKIASMMTGDRSKTAPNSVTSNKAAPRAMTSMFDSLVGGKKTSLEQAMEQYSMEGGKRRKSKGRK